MELGWGRGARVRVRGYISPMSPQSLPCISPISYISRLDDLVDGRGERVEAGELLQGVRVRVRVRVSEGQGEGNS